MARLATDADLGPGGGKIIFGCVVVLVHARRMALGAHEIPVLIELGPVQHVVVLDLVIGIKMKPALTSPAFRSAVPGDGKRLYPAIRKFDEILLKRIDAEGVFDLESRELAVRAVGL